MNLQNKHLMLDLSQFNHSEHFTFSTAQQPTFCAFRLVMHLHVLAAVE